MQSELEEARADTPKRERLEKAGWRAGSAQEFLVLSDAEAAFIDLKRNLRSLLKERSAEGRLTQTELATALEPGQPLDLLVRALLATGATAGDISNAIAPIAVDPGDT